MESFLIAAVIYLGAAVVVVTLSTRLGFGSVLGYLVAGALLGPHALGFVDDPEAVMHFAEFGVVIMLFLIGLELKPYKLWALRRAIVGMGGGQVALSAFIIAAGLLALGLSSSEAVLIGLALALSSTAIVLQTLQERGILDSSVGQNAFSVLLFQDIAVIPILAVVPLFASGSAEPAAVGNSMAWVQDLPAFMQAALTLLVIGGIVVVARYLLRPLFRAIADTQLTELFTGFVLLIVAGVTLAMIAIGLSPALGAFIAGVVLAESDFRHEIEADLNPFKGLLMGLFFLSVGAGIDFALFTDRPGLVLGLAAALMATKFAVLYGVGAFFGFSRSEKMLFGISLAQGGEFAFVIAAAGLTAGALSAQNAELLNLVVAVTMVGTALLFMAHDRLGSIKAAPAPEYDRPAASRPVIIAGYGRFGQIVGRLLTSRNIPVTILESSPGQVDLVRRFGNPIYYGDAARKPLLEQAGAARAALLVVAVDDPVKSMRIIETAQSHFPSLKIIARAVDRDHAYQLMDCGVTAIRRETFHSALELGKDALQALGEGADEAAEHARIFGEHDEHTLKELAPLWGHEKRYGQAVHRNLDNLRRVLEKDDHSRQVDRD